MQVIQPHVGIYEIFKASDFILILFSGFLLQRRLLGYYNLLWNIKRLTMTLDTKGGFTLQSKTKETPIPRNRIGRQ